MNNTEKEEYLISLVQDAIADIEGRIRIPNLTNVGIDLTTSVISANVNTTRTNLAKLDDMNNAVSDLERYEYIVKSLITDSAMNTVYNAIQAGIEAFKKGQDE